MTAANNKLNMNGTPFNWGTTFEQALKIFPYENTFSGYSYIAWQHFEFECDSIFGLDSIICALRAPKPDRPVIQVSFELKPVQKKMFESHYDPYLKRLKKLFGKPHGIGKFPIHGGLKYNEKYAEGSVIYNCKWWWGDVLVTLSVFGGIRSGQYGESAAGLYFDWMNEERAAEPFITSFLEREQAFSTSVHEICREPIEGTQRAYHQSHYELDDPHVGLKDPDLRASQLVLYTDELFRLPTRISNEIMENEIGIFYSGEQDTYCVYNKWDFTPVTKESTLEFTNLLPARGGGRKELRINSLVLIDEPFSTTLDQFRNKIEELSEVKFKYIEGYHD